MAHLDRAGLHRIDDLQGRDDFTAGKNTDIEFTAGQ